MKKIKIMKFLGFPENCENGSKRRKWKNPRKEEFFQKMSFVMEGSFVQGRPNYGHR